MPPQDCTYKYDEAAIIEGIEAIRKTHNDIDNALDGLESRSEANLNSWDGSAKNSYYEYKKKWDGEVDDMKDIMVQHAIPTLNKILEGYQACERLNTAGWQTG